MKRKKKIRIKNYFETLEEAKKYFMQWADKNLKGKRVYHKDIGKYVHFNKKGIRHSIYREASFDKVQLITQAKEMLKNSKIKSFKPDYKKRLKIKGAYKMETYAHLNNRKIKVLLVLREGENGVIYYDHLIQKK